MSKQALVKGSISALAQEQGKSLAETFIGVDCVVLVDTSGSMGTKDSTGGNSRYDQACIELASLQENLPGKIGVLSFSNKTIFCPDGRPFNLGGGTDLTGALKFAKVADVPGMQFIVISDGIPDDPQGALKVAHSYTSRIDVIYVGPEDRPTGRDFLEQLAWASGGRTVMADRVKELATAAQKLLTAA